MHSAGTETQWTKWRVRNCFYAQKERKQQNMQRQEQFRIENNEEKQNKSLRKGNIEMRRNGRGTGKQKLEWKRENDALAVSDEGNHQFDLDKMDSFLCISYSLRFW